MNKASLEYNQTTTTAAVNGGGGDYCDGGLHNILDILELAVEDCHRAMEVINNNNNNYYNNNNKGDATGGGEGCNSCG